MAMKAAAILLGLVILTLFGSAEAASTLTVVGEGEILVPADRVYVTFTVTAEDENATVASMKSSGGLNRTIGALVDAGLKIEDVWSGGARSVSRIHSTSRLSNNSNAVTVAEAGVSRVIDQATVRLDAEDEALVDRTLEAAKAQGAEVEISGYALAEKGAAFAEARRLAVEDAERVAESLASAAGLVLEERLEIFEPSPPRVLQPTSGTDPGALEVAGLFDLSMLSLLDPFEEEVSGEPGMVTVRSRVVVTYQVS